MKKLLVTLLSLLPFFGAYAQSRAEKEIRKLENAQREAFLKKDTVTLFNLFSPNFVVNAPTHKIVTLQDLKLLIRKGEVDLESFDRNIEKIIFVENVAIVMGSETTKVTGNNPNAGKTAKRRYTHVWMKNNKS